MIKSGSLTTKLRVVFDASAKSSNKIFLNDMLIAGPTIQQDLFVIVTRFRRKKYVLTADIEKMHRQILVSPKHTPLQSIVWRERSEKPIDELKTITYGTVCAPYSNAMPKTISSRWIISVSSRQQNNFKRFLYGRFANGRTYTWRSD